MIDRDELDGVSWISWAEIASADPATAPEHHVGRVTWHQRSQPWLRRTRLVSRPWPPDVPAAVGVPPCDPDTTAERVEWTTGELICAYEPLTAGAVLGPPTHWPHVFAVMKALADRFGGDGVRLVVAFD
jgi:hypothetical protein